MKSVSKLVYGSLETFLEGRTLLVVEVPLFPQQLFVHVFGLLAVTVHVLLGQLDAPVPELRQKLLLEVKHLLTHFLSPGGNVSQLRSVSKRWLRGCRWLLFWLR